MKAIASAPSCPKLPGSPTGQTCRYMSGGLFDLSPNSATTLTGPVNDGFDGQGRLDRLRVASYTWDGFAFVSRFKQGVSSSDQALLGLRQGSTVLEEFVKRKIIGTRTWALDYGMSGEPESGMGPWVDGAITFGGYDKGRFVGSLSSEISVKGGTGCGLEVDVMSMVLNRPSGEKTPLFKNGEKKT